MADSPLLVLRPVNTSLNVSRQILAVNQTVKKQNSDFNFCIGLMVHSVETRALVSSAHFTLASIRKGAPITSQINSIGRALRESGGKCAWTMKW